MIVDDQGVCRQFTTEEFAEWVDLVQPGADDAINAIVDLGYIHLWLLGEDVIVSLWPERVNPVTMTSAIDEISRLGQQWTIVHSMASGGKCQVFRGFWPALRAITALMVEAGKIEDVDYEALRKAVDEFSKDGPLARSCGQLS